MEGNRVHEENGYHHPGDVLHEVTVFDALDIRSTSPELGLCAQRPPPSS